MFNDEKYLTSLLKYLAFRSKEFQGYTDDVGHACLLFTLQTNEKETTIH